jgi:acetate kinase
VGRVQSGTPMNVLTLNAGSNSLKFEIVAVNPEDANQETKAAFGRSLVSGVYDNIGKENSVFALWKNKQVSHEEKQEIRDYGHAAELLFQWIEEGKAKEYGIGGLDDLQRIGHRVVHGADRFHEAAVPITEDVIHEIEALADLAPLHNDAALAVIRAAKAQAGSDLPMFAVFDTVFHRHIPDEAALYALPPGLAQRHRIRRYGFHGISHKYLMLRYAQFSKRPVAELRLITLHLEGGSSAAAIRGGKSIDTSMGFTPLEGLMMGTRSGDMDPAIVTYLMRKENWGADEAEKFLNKKCGLLGVSGLSSDTRELIKHRDHPHVELALQLFCYRVRQYIGAYLAVLGGADAIVLGGGIGENMPLLREWICRDFGWCGAKLDRARNSETVDREGWITTADSTLPVCVIPTEENLMMAYDVARQP